MKVAMTMWTEPSRTKTEGQATVDIGPYRFRTGYIQNILHFERHSEVIVVNAEMHRRVFWQVNDPAEIQTLRRLERLLLRSADSISYVAGPWPSLDLPDRTTDICLPFGMSICPECSTSGKGPDDLMCPRCEGNGIVSTRSLEEEELIDG